MTRINCIPVNELTDKHLIAEYRELPRVFKLARELKKWEKPEHYTMGTGHVKFFYDKLAYCEKRFHRLIGEMKKRGFNPQFEEIPINEAPLHLYNDWVPTAQAMEINRQRIKERLS